MTFGVLTSRDGGNPTGKSVNRSPFVTGTVENPLHKADAVKSSVAVRAVMTDLFKTYGLPKVIHSDNGAPLPRRTAF